MSSLPEDSRRTSLPSDEMLEFFRALEEEPYNYGLFATLRRLECGSKDTPRLGRSVKPSEDSVRIGQEPTLAFAPSQLAKFEQRSGGRAPRLSIFAPGLFGPNGPLPLHLTEFVRERQRNFGDESMWRFVDIFHHRMLSLLYRAWANSEPVVNADRGTDDRFTNYVASLIGLGMDSLKDRDAFPDNGRLHYVGHLARQARSPEGLTCAIEDFFGVQAKLEQFVGEWLSVPDEAKWLLGEPRKNGGLGFGTTIGESVWSCQHKFRLTIGPVGFDSFKRFLPGTENSNRLVALVRNFCGDEFDWDVEIILKKEEIPPLQLGQHGLLGRTSWLNQEDRKSDALDARLHPLSGVWRNQAA